MAGRVVILVLGREGHSVVVTESIPCRPTISTHLQFVFWILVTNTEMLICGMELSMWVSPTLQLHPKADRSLNCQQVNVIISKPELWRLCQPAKAAFVFYPHSVEIKATISPSLKHGPSATVCFHIAVNFNLFGLCTIWVYPVHSISTFGNFRAI